MSAQLSQNLLLTVPMAPLVGAVVAGLFGKTVGRRGAHVITILGAMILELRFPLQRLRSASSAQRSLQ